MNSVEINVELLNEVSKAIGEHPLRLDMGEFINHKDVESPCGTAACIAGHAVALDIMKQQGIEWSAATAQLIEEIKSPALIAGSIFRRAQLLLHLDNAEAERLFHVQFWPRGFRELFAAAPDREVRAAVTRDRITHFIETHGSDHPAEAFI